MITKYSGKIEDCKTYKELMGIEGISAKVFFMPIIKILDGRKDCHEQKLTT